MSTAALEYRLGTLNALLGVVEALRSLTAAKQQKAMSLLPDLDRYAGETQTALTSLAPLPVAGHAPQATLVLGPEGGFTGGLAGRLASSVPDDWQPWVVGARMEAALRARHLTMAGQLACPSSVDALPRLAADIAAWLPADAPILVLHPHSHGIDRTDIPPVPVAAGRHDMLIQVPVDNLVRTAGQQAREALLLHLLMVTHIAEQMARLATLTGARERIRDRIGELTVQLSTARQEGISQEIADLWAGRRALHS